MRLDKFVCKSTKLSRYEAIERIHNGKVIVNDQTVINEATQVHENNRITLDGQLLKTRSFRYIAIHKPCSTVCSHVDDTYPSIFNGLNIENVSELHIAGRLDADTTGLVLVTDDGRWTFDIIRPSKQCNKVYRVGLSRPISEKSACLIRNGIQLQGESKPTLPAKMDVIHAKEVRLTITEGKYHQVKRMFAAAGNKVVSLHREKIGTVSLDIEPGKWRYLTENEINSMRKNKTSKPD